MFHLRLLVRRSRLPSRDLRPWLIRLDRVCRQGAPPPGSRAPPEPRTGGCRCHDAAWRGARRIRPKEQPVLAGAVVVVGASAADALFMRIRLSDPHRLAELAAALARAGCPTERIGARTLLIPADVAQVDLAFFVKAWSDHHSAGKPRTARRRIARRVRARGRSALHRCAR